MMLVLSNRESTPHDIPYWHKLREVAAAYMLTSADGQLASHS